METITEEPSNSAKISKASKEIEVLETEWHTTIYSENDRVVRRHYQVLWYRSRMICKLNQF